MVSTERPRSMKKRADASGSPPIAPRTATIRAGSDEGAASSKSQGSERWVQVVSRSVTPSAVMANSSRGAPGVSVQAPLT